MFKKLLDNSFELCLSFGCQIMFCIREAMLVMDSITILFVQVVCEGSHDKLCHLHQKGCWFVFKVVIPACIFNLMICTLC